MNQSFELPLKNGDLRGVIENPGKETIVITAHGFTGDWNGPSNIFLKLSPRLHELGLSTCRFSFLGTPPSGGEYVEMTVVRQEQEVREVVAHIKTLGYEKIVLLGESMGSVVLGAIDSSISALVLWWPAIDFLDTDFRTFLTLEKQKELSEQGYLPIGSFKVGKQFIDEIPLANYFSVIPTVTYPILFVHGENDSEVSVEQSKKAFELAHEPKQLYVVADAEHCCRDEQEEVMNVTVEFLKKHLI